MASGFRADQCFKGCRAFLEKVSNKNMDPQNFVSEEPLTHSNGQLTERNEVQKWPCLSESWRLEFVSCFSGAKLDSVQDLGVHLRPPSNVGEAAP